MRLELQSDNENPNDVFLTAFERALLEQAAQRPSVHGCPTMRVIIHRPSHDEMEEPFVLRGANPKQCAFFAFELFDTTGRRMKIDNTNDGILRANHYAFADGELQLLFDGLPGFDGISSRPVEHAKAAATFIFDQLAQ